MKEPSLIVRAVLMLALARCAEGGYCRTEIRKWANKEINLIFFKFDIPYFGRAYNCCEGYTGEKCTQLTDACRKDAKCRGHWCEVETEQKCKVREKMAEEFMGKDTRLVYKMNSKPQLVEECCAGFTGQKCNQTKSTTLLSADEKKSVKQELTADEEKVTKIYSFNGVKKFGIGHVVKKEEPEADQSEGTVVLEARIQEAFEADLHIAVSDVEKLFTRAAKWPIDAKKVVVNIMFNVKQKKFKQMTGCVSLLERKSWHKAAECLKQTSWANVVKSRASKLADTLRALSDSTGGSNTIKCTEVDDSNRESPTPVNEDGCSSFQAPTNGGAMFSPWSSWSDCTFQCDGALKVSPIRTRSCLNPTLAANGKGKICEGDILDTGNQCGVMKRESSDKDYLCKCKSGTCQKTDQQCSSGLYESGLCNSDTSANYKCCLPVPKKLDCTNAWAKDYACKLVGDTQIGWSTADGRGNPYSSTIQNIQDACDGKSASRSYYTDGACSDPGSPGGEVCLTATLLKFMYDVNKEVKAKANSGIYVTSLAGANHGCTSKHYSGKALDMRSITETGTSIPDNTKTWIKTECESVAGYFTDAYTDKHIHCGVAKPDVDAPCEKINGICQDNSISCSQPYKSGLCGGTNTRQCCIYSYDTDSNTDDTSNPDEDDTDSNTDDTSNPDEDLLTATELSNVKEQLKIDEGYKTTIYNDSRGYLTFGIGHKITESDPEYGQPIGTKVTETRIHEVFIVDVGVAIKDVIALFADADDLPGEVKEITVNMAFNLGRTGLGKFVKFIAAVDGRDWNTAADEMVDSDWYHQVGIRAVRLVARMRAVKK